MRQDRNPNRYRHRRLPMHQDLAMHPDPNLHRYPDRAMHLNLNTLQGLYLPLRLHLRRPLYPGMHLTPNPYRRRPLHCRAVMPGVSRYSRIVLSASPSHRTRLRWGSMARPTSRRSARPVSGHCSTASWPSPARRIWRMTVGRTRASTCCSSPTGICFTLINRVTRCR